MKSTGMTHTLWETIIYESYAIIYSLWIIHESGKIWTWITVSGNSFYCNPSLLSSHLKTSRTKNYFWEKFELNLFSISNEPIHFCNQFSEASFQNCTNVHWSSMIGQILSMDDRTGPNNCTTGPNWFGGPRFWSEFYLVRSVVLS